MNTIIRPGAVIFLLVLVAACGNSGPASPNGTNPPEALPPEKSFPSLYGPSRTFLFDREVSSPVSDFTWNSRFVLYDNGAFVLQYPSSGPGDGRLRGEYQNANGVITFLFEFQGRRVGSPWDATGTLDGDSLTVYYTESMHHNDFEDAVYELMR